MIFQFSADLSGERYEKLFVGAWLMLTREFADTDEKIVQSKLGHCTDERAFERKNN